MSSAVQTRGPLVSEPRDYNHATDREYQRLRDLADQAYGQRNSLSQQSQAAFHHGDKAKAHELSEEAKRQLQKAEDYNSQAAQYVFVANNADSSGNEIDLHGLYVKEAEYFLKQRICAGISRHESQLHVIVGKGTHSANGISKLKPAIEGMCKEANLRNHIDRKNSGVLLIELEGASVPSSWNVLPQQQSQYNQPHYQQQPQYQQQQHAGKPDTGFSQYDTPQNRKLLKSLLRIVCNCIRN